MGNGSSSTQTEKGNSHQHDPDVISAGVVIMPSTTDRAEEEDQQQKVQLQQVVSGAAVIEGESKTQSFYPPALVDFMKSHHLPEKISSAILQDLVAMGATVVSDLEELEKEDIDRLVALAPKLKKKNLVKALTMAQIIDRPQPILFVDWLKDLHLPKQVEAAILQDLGEMGATEVDDLKGLEREDIDRLMALAPKLKQKRLKKLLGEALKDKEQGEKLFPLLQNRQPDVNLAEVRELLFNHHADPSVIDEVDE